MFCVTSFHGFSVKFDTLSPDTINRTMSDLSVGGIRTLLGHLYCAIISSFSSIPNDSLGKLRMMEISCIACLHSVLQKTLVCKNKRFSSNSVWKIFSNCATSLNLTNEVEGSSKGVIIYTSRPEHFWPIRCEDFLFISQTFLWWH